VLSVAAAGKAHAQPYERRTRSRRAGGWVEYHQRNGADGIEIAHSVHERLPFVDDRGVLLEGEDVRAESLRRHLEGAAGARAGLEVEGDHVPAAQEAPAVGLGFPGARLRPLALEARRQREQSLDLGPGQRLQ